MECVLLSRFNKDGQFNLEDGRTEIFLNFGHHCGLYLRSLIIRKIFIQFYRAENRSYQVRETSHRWDREEQNRKSMTISKHQKPNISREMKGMWIVQMFANL